MNQFFYTYEANGKKLFGCFNVNYVIRAAEIEPGQLIVILDDGHEEAQDKEVLEKGKPVLKRERNWVLSQILLVGEDMERFKQVMKHPETASVKQPELPFPTEI